MRTLITIALFALSFFSASAQYGRSVLNLRLSNNAPFRLVIDGQPVDDASSTIRLTRLAGGKHALQIYRVVNQWGYTHQRLLFNGSVMLAANAESWATVYPEIQKIEFDEIRALGPNRDCFNPRAPKPVIESCDADAHNNYPPVPVGPCAMAPADFIQLKQTIDNAGFENTRINIFRQALAYNYFTTGQVRDLMNLFWFEKTKLEVAKLAYPKTLDQNNYYLVNNEFSFSSSVDELGNYIAMR